MDSKLYHPELGQFILGREIGRGSYAVVYSATYSLCECPVAVKIFDSRIFDDPEELEYAKKEFELQKSVSHPLIPKAHEMFVCNGRLCVIMELVEGNTLLDFANTVGTTSEPQARKIFGQLILILEYLHNKLGIVHRDIKCENIIIDSQFNVHLIDFGFAKRCERSCEKDQIFVTTCGSPAYVAPEIIENKPYNFLVDVWSAGVVLYAILCGRLPFQDPNISTMLELIVGTEPEYPPRLSMSCVDLLRRMLTKDPHARISVPELKEHPWIVHDENGRRQKLNGEIFDQLVKDHTRIEELDRSLLQALRLEDKDQGRLVNDLLSGKDTWLTRMYEIGERAKLKLAVAKYAGMIFVADTQRLPQRTGTYSQRSTGILPKLVSGTFADRGGIRKRTYARLQLSQPELPEMRGPPKLNPVFGGRRPSMVRGAGHNP